MTDDDILAGVLEREGGYVDNAADRGGPTCFGVTQAELAAWRGAPVTAAEVKAMPRAEAVAIYRARYLVAPGFVAVARPELRALLVDAAVNHGPAAAVKMLQRALTVPDAGGLGPLTLAALARAGAPRVYLGVCAERAKFYGAIVTRDSSQAVFAYGWMSRLASFISSAPLT